MIDMIDNKTDNVPCYEIGDKVWHIAEAKPAIVTEVIDNPSREYRTYALGQTEEQVRCWGRIYWCAWLDKEDLAIIREE